MSTTQVEQIAVRDLHVDGNPRKSMDEDELKNLVKSIEHNGILEPLRIVKNNQGFRIESGQRRWTAALALGLDTVPCIVVTPEDVAAEQVAAIVTNVQREDMNPVDEARAYELLGVQHGLTVAGIADRVGVPKARVTSRLDLLELPEEIIGFYADERLPLSARTSLRDIAKVSTDLAIAVAKVCLDKPDWGEVLAKDPGRAADYVAKDPKLGKKFVHAGGEVLHVDWNGNVENPLGLKDDVIKPLLEVRKTNARVTWDEEALDSLNAGGVLYRKGESVGVITDLPYAKDAAALVIERKIAFYKKQLEADARSRAREMVKSGDAGEAQVDQQAEELRDFRRQLNEAHKVGQAKGRAANAELGQNLLTQAAKVDTGGLSPEAVDVVVHQLVARDLPELFQRGLRYCLPQYEVREEKQVKGETRVKVTYKATTKAEATKLALEFLGGAKKPDEKLGRAIVLIAAAHWADQGVVPQSQQLGSGLRQANLGYDYSKGENGTTSGASLGTFALPVEKLVDKALIPAALRAKIKPSQKQRQALMDANPELAAKVNSNQTR